jgi:molecular chaperone GrpE
VATAGADTLKNILPVIDDFDRALKNMETAADVLAVCEGVELIYSKLKNTLQGKGLEEMKAVGEPFDADIHEAITQIPVTNEEMKGRVVEELEKGYYLHGKVIRYAKVIVGS